jgi:hypothetical protein
VWVHNGRRQARQKAAESFSFHHFPGIHPIAAGCLSPVGCGNPQAKTFGSSTYSRPGGE